MIFNKNSNWDSESNSMEKARTPHLIGGNFRNKVQVDVVTHTTNMFLHINLRGFILKDEYK